MPAGENPAPDPLIMAQGGPGGSTIETYTSALLMKPEILNDRDVVLFDQRGTLHSDPSLVCPEVVDFSFATIDEVIDPKQGTQMYLDALNDCRRRLQNEGVDLAAYNSLENAADIDSIRQALGYDKVNFYGVSYGSLLGFHLLRTHPEWLRSAVLDGIVPPDRNFLEDASQSGYRSFQLMFETCQQDKACHKAYPNLESDFVALVKQLNEKPIQVMATDMENFKDYPALVDGYTLVSMFHQMLYSSDIVVALPRTVYDLKHGKTEFFGKMLGLVSFDRTMSEGMYYSVICSEDADINFEKAKENLVGLPEWMTDGEGEDLKSITGICKTWGSTDLNPAIDEVVKSSIPVLLLNGEMDPITPPVYGEHASQSLENVTNLVFPGMGHGQFASNDCATSISLSFLNDPTQKVDASCIKKMGLPKYLTPRTMIEFPLVYHLLNLKPYAILSILLFLMLVFFLGLSWLVLPVAWIIRRINHTQLNAPASFLARMTIWLPGFSSLLLGIFGLGIGIVSNQLIQTNQAVIFFGMPMSAWPLFALAYLACLLLALVCITSVKAWVKGWWSVLMRAYLSLLALAGLATVGIILLWRIV